MDKIKYILWDIDGTLIDFDYAEKEGLKMCFKKFNLGKLTNEMLEEYKVINDSYWKRHERGEISRIETLEGRFRDWFNMYGFDIKIVSEFNIEYQNSMGSVARFNSNGEEVINKLKGNYKQYAATNGTIRAQNKKLSKTGLNKMLDGIFISDEVGYNKPSIEYFKAVFDKVGSNNKEEYVIIGDSLTSDILGGIRVGIKTIWFNPKNKDNNYDYKPDYEIYDLIEVLDIL